MLETVDLTKKLDRAAYVRRPPLGQRHSPLARRSERAH